MKKTFISATKNIFAVLVMYAVFVGVIVFLMFTAGIIVGGNFGTTVAVQAGKLMNTAIPVSAIGATIALVGFYVGNNHALTVDNKKSED